MDFKVGDIVVRRDIALIQGYKGAIKLRVEVIDVYSDTTFEGKVLYDESSATSHLHKERAFHTYKFELLDAPDPEPLDILLQELDKLEKNYEN